jgi:glycosyltransferase involved in cell wall biosynthesis
MMDKLVSVHITTYNRAKELERCVRSVWTQTYPNMEIIIADDCSPDDTPAVVERLRAESPFPIKYVRHEANKGNAYARNSCLKISSGYYVAFLDDDDEWIDPEKTEKQVALLNEANERGVGFVATRVRILEPGSEHVSSARVPTRIVSHILKRNGLFYSPSVLTTRAVLDQAGGFDVRLPRGVDSDFYRFCIVELGLRPEILGDLSVSVHAEGEGRMTEYATREALGKEIASHCWTLRKYWPVFVRNPAALAYRVRKILVARLRWLALPKRCSG